MILRRKGVDMKKISALKALKIAGAAIGAILFADLLDLQYSITAGIITVLSIQNTKRETLKTARNRTLAFLCALIISWVCYNTLGFHVLSFAIYLLVFAFLCLIAKWPEAIAMDSVLISHFLTEKSFDITILTNEILLFLIGTTFGIVVNLLLRRKGNEFDAFAQEVDEEIKGIIGRMAINLRIPDKQNYNGDCFIRLEDKITAAKNSALQNWNNTLWNNSTYELNYIKMRENQKRVLKNIYNSIKMICYLPKQTEEVAKFLTKIQEEYHRDNDVEQLLKGIHTMYEEMREEKLPVSREEFEARAVLFYILKQLEELLELKREFIKSI